MAGCAGVDEYRLTTAQLAWQGYQVGQILRFAQRPAGPVRTYRISSITDEMERQPQGINFTLLPRKDIDCEHLAVSALRTDTVASPLPVLDFKLEHYAGQDIYLRSTVGWDNFNAAGQLPLDEINQGIGFDTLQYAGLWLLPTATFGGVAYTSVVRIRDRYAPPGVPLTGVRMLYYAKGKGIVAFQETGALWYRLP